MNCRRRLIPVLCATALFGTGGAAMADDGVTIDSPNNGPAQKEYAIPLQQARKDATGGGDAAPDPSSSSPSSSDTSSSDAAAPLFGEGIGDDSSAGGKGNHAGSSAGTAAGQDTDQPSTSSGSDSVDSALTSARAGTAVASGGGSGVLTIGAVALAVLLLGGVLGSIAQRRGRSS